MKKAIYSTLSLVLFCPQVYAADFSPESELMDIFGGDELVSIATGLEQPVSKAPAVASVITSQDIERLGATDIDDVLETIPGLHVARDAAGYNPIYTFRGVYADYNPQVLMLINGVPITNLVQGDRNSVWGGMPVNAISRIEVIRGPGSAVYGADAFAGVINIITKAPDDVTGTRVGARYGSFDTKDMWVETGGTVGQVGYMAILEWHRTDGQDERIRSDAQSLLDSLTGTDASYAPGGVNLGRDNLDLRLQFDYENWIFRLGAQIRRDAENGAGAAEALDPNNKFSSDRLSADITYNNERFAENLGLQVQASYLQTSQEVDDDLVLYPPGSTGPFLNPDLTPVFSPFQNGVIGNPEVYERHSRLNITTNYSGFKDHLVRTGLGYYYGDVYKVRDEKNFRLSPPEKLPTVIDFSDTPDVYLREGDRENYYLFMQDVWHLSNDWELTAGVRYDHYSDFGSTTNPRAALVWSASHALTIKWLYGEAFRAPSFTQTRAINNPVVLGNPDLDPETIKSYEMAFDYRPAVNLSFNANFFYYKWNDIIQFAAIGGGASRAANAGEQKGHGLELEATWDVTDRFSLYGNFAWQKSTDETSDKDAANAPEKQFYLRANWEFQHDWNLNVQSNWVMDRNREAMDPRSDIDDYVVVDLTLRRKNLWRNWEAALLIKNLFDEDAREPSPLSILPNGTPVAFIPDDLPLAGRSVLGELRYKF